MDVAFGERCLTLQVSLARPPLTEEETTWKKGVRTDHRNCDRRGEFPKKGMRFFEDDEDLHGLEDALQASPSLNFIHSFGLGLGPVAPSPVAPFPDRESVHVRSLLSFLSLDDDDDPSLRRPPPGPPAGARLPRVRLGLGPSEAVGQARWRGGESGLHKGGADVGGADLPRVFGKRGRSSSRCRRNRPRGGGP